MNKIKFCEQGFWSLLRYGRKNGGGWDYCECEPEDSCTLPDDDNIYIYHLTKIHQMAAESLDPENFENLEKALIRLAKTRKIDWQPE